MPKIINNGITNLVETEGLYFCTTYNPNFRYFPYGVYMRHGSPGGAFWKNGEPIKYFKNREQANEFIDELAGLVDAHKAFEDNYFTV